MLIIICSTFTPPPPPKKNRCVSALFFFSILPVFFVTQLTNSAFCIKAFGWSMFSSTKLLNAALIPEPQVPRCAKLVWCLGVAGCNFWQMMVGNSPRKNVWNLGGFTHPRYSSNTALWGLFWVIATSFFGWHVRYAQSMTQSAIACLLIVQSSSTSFDRFIRPLFNLQTTKGIQTICFYLLYTVPYIYRDLPFDL